MTQEDKDFALYQKRIKQRDEDFALYIKIKTGKSYIPFEETGKLYEEYVKDMKFYHGVDVE